MLTDLNIKNIAIIDSLHVAFGPGLNVLTGETGAGKSIIVDAVELLLGGRASTDLIRAGEEEATAEALFDLSGRPELLSELAGAGVECEGELLVKRVVARSGRNRVFVGGSLSTVGVLSEVASLLINIYGQHESQTLLKPENHLLLVDAYAGCTPLRQEFGVLHAAYRAAEAELKILEEGERDRERRIDQLAFQAEEIARAALQPDEEEELERERVMLTHAERLFSASQGAYELLYGGDGALLGELRRATASIADARGFDPRLAPVSEVLEDSYARLEDAALILRDYAARIEADPARLAMVDDRLDLIGRLKRKYGDTVAEVILHQGSVERELELLRNVEASRNEIEGRLAGISARMKELGAMLSAARREGAGRLSAAMGAELHDLAMPSARFTVSFDELPEPRATGLERGEFLFSPNPGEPQRPLARIASGGELSRLMLALKQLHPESDVPTLVFDEVDTGIGGATSAMVGRKLKRVALNQQVLCITHLPQVAACADRHYRVEKRQETGRTVTSVACLDPDGRVAELARMLGGVRISDTTLEHARELIAEALP
jgi:DNA repair protein RecN (Recombination protein N)